MRSSSWSAATPLAVEFRSDSLSQVQVSAAIIVLVIVLVILRQFSTRRVTPWTFAWIVILLLVGFQPPGPALPTVTGIGIFTFGIAVSAAFGAWRGSTMPMWRDDKGVVYSKGNQLTLVQWLLTIVARLVVAGVGGAVFHQPLNVGALWLGFATTLAVQQFVALRRAARIPALQLS